MQPFSNGSKTTSIWNTAACPESIFLIPPEALWMKKLLLPSSIQKAHRHIRVLSKPFLFNWKKLKSISFSTSAQFLKILKKHCPVKNMAPLNITKELTKSINNRKLCKWRKKHLIGIENFCNQQKQLKWLNLNKSPIPTPLICTLHVTPWKLVRTFLHTISRLPTSKMPQFELSNLMIVSWSLMIKVAAHLLIYSSKRPKAEKHTSTIWAWTVKMNKTFAKLEFRWRDITNVTVDKSQVIIYYRKVIWFSSRVRIGLILAKLIGNL